MFMPMAAFTLAVELGVFPSPAAKQVVMENRVFTVSLETAEKLRRLTNLGDQPNSKPFDEARVREVMKILDADRDAQVMSSPKIVTDEDRSATVQIGNFEEFAFGMDVQMRDGQPVCMPKTERSFVGYSFTATPSIADDGRTLKLALESQLTSRPTEARRVPFTYFVTPSFEGGAGGRPIPVTQWFDATRPEVNSVKLTATILSGQSILILSGRRMMESRREQSVPLLSKIPSVGKLFTNTTKSQEPKETFLLVTTRIVEE